MSNKSKGTDTSDKTGAAPKYTLEKLRANCRALFNVSTSTFDGATHGLTGKFTVEEMRTHIEAWKRKEVK